MLNRLVGSTVFLSFAVAVFGVHTSGMLHPWMPAFLLISIGAVIVASAALDTIRGVLWVVVIGLLHRFVTFYHPATLSGEDPDKIAAAANRVIDSGSLSSIEELSFYSRAPFFFLETTASATIGGVPAQDAVVVYTFLITLLVPVSVAIVTRFVHFLPPRAAVVAAALSTSFTLTSVHAVWPIPQQHAVLLFLVFVVLLLFHTDHRDSVKITSALLIVVLLSIVLSHKVVILFVGAGVAGVIVLTGVENLVPSLSRRRSSTGQPIIASLWPILLLAVLVTLVHWSFVTDFIHAVVFRFVQPLLSDPGPVSRPSDPFSSGFRTDLGFPDVLVHNGHWLLLAPLAGVGWLIAWWRGANGIVTGFSAAIGALFVVLFVAAISTHRVLLVSEPIFAVLVTVLLFASIESARRGSTIAGVFVLAILLVAQVGTPTATLDHPDATREYMTEGELSAKHFAAEYATTTVHTDYYYARQNMHYRGDGVSWRPGGSDPSPDQFAETNGEFITGTIHEQEYPYIQLRPSIEVYRFFGNWRITWNPESAFDSSTHHHRLYDNGDVTLYQRTNTSTLQR